MIMEHRRRKGDDMSISVTPLIDVILVLLIFFMVSSRFTRDTQMNVNLPKATGEAALAASSNVVEVSVDANGNIFVNAKALANGQIETIKSALQSESNGNSELPLIISADAKAPYQAVATAMDAAGQMGFHKLTMAAQAPRDG
jgi:biopolymer transport protein ExbD